MKSESGISILVFLIGALIGRLYVDERHIKKLRGYLEESLSDNDALVENCEKLLKENQELYQFTFSEFPNLNKEAE